EQLYVITKLDVGSDPGIAHVVLEQHAQRTIVVCIGETAINFSACEDKTAALAQCDQLLQIVELARWRLFRHSSGHTPKRVTNERGWRATSGPRCAPLRACTAAGPAGWPPSHPVADCSRESRSAFVESPRPTR